MHILSVPGLDKSLVKSLTAAHKAREPYYFNTAFAKTGQLGDDGKPQANPCIGLPDGQIWVRQSFDSGVTFSRAAVPAINVGVRDDLTDTPVIIGFDSPNPGATLYAIGVAGSPEAAQQYGKALAAIGTPNTPPSVMNNPVPSALVQDGRVLAPADGSLGFYVETDPQFGWNGGVIPIDPGDIPAGAGEFGGLVVYFPEYSGTPVVPTYLPTTPVVRPNKQAWIDGNLSDAVNLTLPSGSARLFAVTVFNGQIAVTSSNTSFINLRRAKVPEGLTDFYQTVQDNGTPETQRGKLNFIGATVTDNPGNDSTDVTLPGSSGTFPKRATMFHNQALSLSGTLVTIHDNNQNDGFYTYFGVGSANGDSFSNSCMLRAGINYTLSLLGITNNDGGKVDITLDGVAIVTGQDWYSASVGYNVVKAAASITVATDGYHTLVGTIHGQNGLSIGYALPLTNYWFSPSAD